MLDQEKVINCDVNLITFTCIIYMHVFCHIWEKYDSFLSLFACLPRCSYLLHMFCAFSCVILRNCIFGLRPKVPLLFNF